MRRKDERIIEIMRNENVDHDTAESLFLCEIQDMFPWCDSSDIDTLEMLYETDSETSGRQQM